jgi:hypothetical protein
MSNSKISALTSVTTPLAGTEVLPIIQSGATKQVSVANLTAGRSVSASNFIPSNSTVPTNGMYLPATNSVGIATNTTSAIRIDSSQNVGLGSTTTSGGRLVISQSNATQPAIYFPTDETTIQGPGTNTLIKMGSNLSLQSSNQTTIAAKSASGVIVFGTGAAPTEASRIDSNLNYVVSVAAKGINFTANTPTAGMTSQLLNWYEEGTWTPNQGAGLTVVGGLTATGTYTRIGRSITITAKYVAGTSMTIGVANVLSSNAPYTASSSFIYTGTISENSITSGGVVVLGGTTIYTSQAFTSKTQLWVTITYNV